MDGGAGEKSANGAQGAPGALTRLLEKLAAAPEGEAGQAWAEGLRPGDLLDGRFEILRELGRGGFGAVYEALDRELGRRVAVKTLRPGRARDEWADEQLKKEAQAAASLSHPGVVTLFEACTCDRGPYLVMELLRGETLDERLLRGPLSSAEVVEVGLQTSRALAHVHAHGLVHRDLKPGNLLLGEDGRVKLLDLGLAHLLGRKAATGGTPAYVAPEQWRGETVDGRADVFSLGAVLYEAVSGRRPFEVKEERSTALDPGEAPTLPRSVPGRLARLVARCLAKDPRARPTAAQVAEELLGVQRAAGGSVVRKWTRLAAMVAGAVAVGAGIYWLVARRTATEGPATAPTTLPSVAVLPFVDLSQAKDQDYFCDGVAEEILNALAAVDGLRVPGRVSSFRFKGTQVDPAEIGRRLGVDHLLEGSVRRDGKRLRVRAEVVRAEDGARVWAQGYDRDATGVFEVQDEIARAVVAALKVTLLPGQRGPPEARPTSQEAYESYLLGKRFAQSERAGAMRRAVAAFERAAALDPGYAQAWIGLSLAQRGVGVFDDASWPTAWPASLASAERAVALAPDLPAALATRGEALLTAWKWEEARRDLDRAVAIAPDDVHVVNAQAAYAFWMGKLPDLVSWSRRATQLDPLDGGAWNTLAVGFWFSGQLEEAERAFARAVEVDPDGGFAGGNRMLMHAYTGPPAAALEECRRIGLLSCVVCAEAALHHEAQAEEALMKLLERARGGDRLVGGARAATCMGRKDQAFELLREAVATHARGLNGLRIAPFWEPLRADPRWSEILRSMGL